MKFDIRHHGPKGSSTAAKWVTDVFSLLVPSQAEFDAVTARVAALETEPDPGPTPDPTPTPTPAATGVGPRIIGNSKSNQQTGGTDKRRVAALFVADRDGMIVGIRQSFRGGTGGYSGGNGGTIRISVQPEGGGTPIGTTAQYVPANSGVFTTYPEVLPSVPVKAGQRLWVVYEDTDPDPTKNFCSTNHLFNWAKLIPRQPRFKDSEYALLFSINGGAWQVDPKHTPTLDIRYADGHHQGMGYVGMIGAISTLTGNPGYAPISGSKLVRSTWTNPSAVSISSLFAGVRHASGTDPLLITVLGPSGRIAGVSIPASSIPESDTSGQDEDGQVTVTGTMAPVTIPAGQLEVRLTTLGSSLYTACPIRDGVDVGFDASLAWPFGQMQTSTDGGSTWHDVYPGVDLQWGGA